MAYPLGSTSDFKEKLTTVKKEYPKASHYCFAYRLGIEGNEFRVSDDGEPSGSAGRPILGQIDSRQLTNVLIIVVRYFGGTLLGVPGLINAYKMAAAMALQVVPAVLKPVLAHYRLQFDYTRLNDIMKVIKQSDCVIISQEINLFCVLELGVPRKNQEYILMKINEVPGIEIVKLS